MNNQETRIHLKTKETLTGLKDQQSVNLKMEKNDKLFLYFSNSGKLDRIEVEGVSLQDSRTLKEILAKDLPSFTTIAGINKNDRSIDIRVTSYPAKPVFLDIEVAVRKEELEKWKKPPVRARKIEDAVQWLNDECIFTSFDGTRSYTLLKTDPEIKETTDEDNDNTPSSFLIQGKRIEVFVKKQKRKVEGKRHPEEYFLAYKFRKKNKSNPKGYVLCESVKIMSDSETSRIRTSSEKELGQLIAKEDSYLGLWKKFGKFEEGLLNKRKEELGELQIEHAERTATGYEITIPLSKSGKPFTDRDSICISEKSVDELEISADPESAEYHLNIEDVHVDDYQRKQVIQIKDPGKIEEGYFCSLSLKGDVKRFERRQEAQEKIESASTPLKTLGLILEGAIDKIPEPKHSNDLALTTAVEKKIFPKNPPTSTQKDAIQFALQTPDICLIQGPPGTGKTTVITAINERFSEQFDSSLDRKSQVSLSSFQHDAVENASERSSIFGLVPLKVGMRSEEKENLENETAYEKQVKQWSEKIIGALNAQNLKSRSWVDPVISKLINLYFVSPCDGKELQSLLEELHERTKELLSSELIQKIRNTIASLEANDSEDPFERQKLTKLIKAIRCEEESFKDDGVSVCHRILREMKSGNRLSTNQVSALTLAANWTAEKGEPDFLKELKEIREELLFSHLPLPPHIKPQVKLEVAELMESIRNELEKCSLNQQDLIDRALIEFRDQLENEPEILEKTFHNYSFVVASTAQQVASYEMKKIKSDDIEFEFVVIDEAARANPLDLLIPMSLGKKIILVGDHRHLPHLVETQLEKEVENMALSGDELKQKVDEVLHGSLFGELFRTLKRLEEKDKIPRIVTLDAQYRSHPILGNFINEHFYHPYDEAFKSPLPAEAFKHSLSGYEGKAAIWKNITGEKEEKPDKSYIRKPEAKWIASELKRLMLNNPDNLTFGVISFYKAQAEAIRQELKQVWPDYETEINQGGEEQLRIGTVDSFQGREFDVVFLSAVRSNDIPINDQKSVRKYGHLMIENRQNVSMSRQKKLLIVVGDARMFNDDRSAKYVKGLHGFLRLCKSASEGAFL